MKTLCQLGLTISLLIFGISAFAIPSQLEGGVSGGGGNVLNPTPPSRSIDEETAEHLVKSSYRYVKILVQEKFQKMATGNLNQEDFKIYAKILRGPKDIFAVIDQVRPKVEEEKPCYDLARKPVDASIVSKTPNTFCVSSYSLAKKVDAEEIPLQSSALMIHEYSEIMGLSEQEAVELQAKALEDLNAMDLPPLPNIEE